MAIEDYSLRDREYRKFVEIGSNTGSTAIVVTGLTDDLSTSTTQITDVAPALLQTINVTNLNAVGSIAGSNVGAWVNMSNYANKSIYFVYTSGATGGQVVSYQASPNAGTNFVTIGSQVFSTATSGTVISLTQHYEYMRTLTTGTNSGGTLTTIITGRGGA